MLILKVYVNRLRGVVSTSLIKLQEISLRLRLVFNNTVFVSLLYWTRDTTYVSTVVSKEILKTIEDVTSSTEASTLSLDKTLQELSFCACKLELTLAKSYIEHPVILETLSIISTFFRDIEEIQSNIDTVSLAVDTVGANETSVLGQVMLMPVVTPVPEFIDKQDSFIFENDKGVLELPSLQESFVTNSSFVRGTLDSATVIEASAFNTTTQKLDSSDKQDAYSLVVAKPLLESNILADHFTRSVSYYRELEELCTPIEVATFSISISNLEVLSATDLIKTHTVKNAIDTTNKEESGNVTNQSYVDITYFEEAYIGDYREI